VLRIRLLSLALLPLLIAPIAALASDAESSPSESAQPAQSAVDVCESSAWARGYRSGCRDMCIVISLPLLAEDADFVSDADLSKAQERCGTHCYDFCVDQLGKLGELEKPEEPRADDKAAAPSGPDP
jgi:hypothetical protein